MNFFVKYKLQINIVLLIFWMFIIYDNYTSVEFKLIKIALPIAFIILTFFNIYKAIKERKSRN